LDTTRFSIESFGGKLGQGRKVVGLILMFALLLISWSRAAEANAQEDKRKVVRQVAQEWVQVATKQFDKGFYEQAEKSLIRAQDYKEFLNADEQKQLSELLGKAHTAAIERKQVLEDMAKANQLVEQGQFAEAKGHLEAVQNSEFLLKQERELVAESLKRIEGRVNTQKEDGDKKQITELYNQSVEYYQAGELEKAREGFLKVARSDLQVEPKGKRAVDYLVKIDDVLLQRTESPLQAGAEEKGGAKAEKQKTATAEPMPENVESADSKTNVVRSYTKAIVNDAKAKAQEYIGQGAFDKARATIESAGQSVNKNRELLGENLFRQYIEQLTAVTEKIAQGQNEKEQQQLQKQKEKESQREYIEQMRAKVNEMLKQSIISLQEKRYEEAAGQLEKVLEIVRELAKSAE